MAKKRARAIKLSSARYVLAATPGINFKGNVESKEIVEGGADVVVTDGFTGNIFIKTAEATAKLMQRVMVEELTAGPISSMGAFLAQAALCVCERGRMTASLGAWFDWG